MRLFWILLITIIYQGCAYHTITTTSKIEGTDGDLLVCHAAGISWFESSDKFAANACGGNVEALGVKGDSEMLGSVINAAVGAAVKAVTP